MSESFQERVDAVRRRIAEACARSGRAAADVAILPVAKTFGPDAVREAAACGFSVIGENKVQEAAQKIPLCPGHLEWHMIGHLQTNKVRVAAQLFSMIHSLDSLRALEAVDRECEAAGRVLPVLLEVNVAGERSKFGFPPDGVPAALDACSKFMHVDIAGLMTMPPFAEDPEEARPFFRRLRELRDGWREQCGVPLRELSMGMSHDFEVAVEEGATWVRLGTVLFGPRQAARRLARLGGEDPAEA
jgi:PLP dependent protein